VTVLKEAPPPVLKEAPRPVVLKRETRKANDIPESERDYATTQMSSTLALRTEISTRVEGHAVVERDLLTPRLLLAIIGVAFFLIVLLGMFREMKDSWRQEPKVDGASPRLQPGR